MSLILEALRKLDREKQVSERGFLVMAPAAWPSQDQARRQWAWLVLAAVALGIGAIALVGRAPRARTAEAAQPVRALVSTVPPLVSEVAAPPVAVRIAAPSTLGRPEAVPPPDAAVATKAAEAASAEPTLAAAKAPAFVLQAITERDGQPLAMINDRTLREGDEIDGARIVKIGDTFVEIDYQGRRMALRF